MEPRLPHQTTCTGHDRRCCFWTIDMDGDRVWFASPCHTLCFMGAIRLSGPRNTLGCGSVVSSLRAFMPKVQKMVRAAAQAFRPNPAIKVREVITVLPIDEVLVSVCRMTVPRPRSSASRSFRRRRRSVQSQIRSSLLSSMHRRFCHVPRTGGKT